MSDGTRFVDVPASTLLTELQSIGAAIEAKGGKSKRGQQGREIVYDFTPPDSPAVVRLYTTLAAGESAVRDCGEDAVRLVVGIEYQGRWRSLTQPRKMLRTAPQNPEHHVRVRAFLDRLTEALRDAYRVALKVPTCPQCRSPMATRKTRDGERRFYGCIRYPECKGTKPFT